MDVGSILARGNAAMAQGIRYKLGKGGMNPNAASPAASGQLDCSGFVAWCLGMSRKTTDRFYVQFNGGWIETTAVWNDIAGNLGIFESASERPGAVVVYPDADGSEGHIGIIVERGRVIHCSKSNDARTGNAIQVTSTEIFTSKPKARFGWLFGLSDAAIGREAARNDGAGVISAPNYRSLVAGGFFASNPNDLAVKRSIRTNNPGALNISTWQRSFPGFVGTTQPDSAGNVTAIYVTPEHGVAAWYHLLAVRYGYGRNGKLIVGDLARRYSGAGSPDAPAARAYVAGWGRWSDSVLGADSQVDLGSAASMVVLARAMFAHEAGVQSPLGDDQIVEGWNRERSGTLPVE